MCGWLWTKFFQPLRVLFYGTTVNKFLPLLLSTSTLEIVTPIAGHRETGANLVEAHPTLSDEPPIEVRYIMEPVLPLLFRTTAIAVFEMQVFVDPTR